MTSLPTLVRKWKDKAELLLDTHCRKSKYFSEMTEEEKQRFRFAQCEATTLNSCASELEKVIKEIHNNIQKEMKNQVSETESTYDTY